MAVAQASDLLAKAIQHHQSGRFAEAEGLYRQVLAVDPRHAVSLNLLGMIALQLGRDANAVEFLRKVIAVQPSFPDAHFNLGIALKNLGRLEDSAAAYRAAIGETPGNYKAHSNLGAVLYRLGRHAEAASSYRRTVALKADLASAYYNLGLALDALGNSEDAAAAYRQAIALAPDYAEAHADLGIALKKLGRLGDAAAAIRRAIALRPDFSEAHSNLGAVLFNLGQLEEAVASYRKAVALNPNAAEAHANLGGALKEMGRLGEAASACRRAVALKPSDAAAHYNLANALLDSGKQDEAVAAYRQSVALDSSFPEVHSNLLRAMHYSMQYSRQNILAEARKYAARFAPSVPGRFTAAVKKSRRLRIGYVSGDFRIHSVSSFLTRVIPAHDRESVEVFCYSNHPLSDGVTEQLRAASDSWRSLVGVTDQEAAQAIRRDGVDILVDLSGHTANNRLPLFAMKPAPVQVTWLGYFGTTGLTEMDYILADRFVLPEAHEQTYTETVIRLPGSYLCFTPPDLDIAIGPPPLAANGFATFGCFNNCAKITPEAVALFARVLTRVPGSRLLLKASSLADETVGRDLLSRFAARGIGAERLLLEGPSPMAAYLAAYNRVDVALDPLPFGGGTTTAQTLWMGTPVVTLRGETWVGRISESILTVIGHAELVANSPNEYVEIAANLAGDPPLLSALRRGLRERLESSALCDGAKFTRNLEEAYRRMAS